MSVLVFTVEGDICYIPKTFSLLKCFPFSILDMFNVVIFIDR